LSSARQRPRKRGRAGPIDNQGEKPVNKSLIVAIGAAIVGALIVVTYNKLVPLAPPPGACPGGDPHCIEVHVITVNGQAQIAPIADHYVRDPGAVISWMIGTSGYTFPSDGIAFNKASNPPPTSTEFINCHNAGADKFQCTDRKQSLGTFGYTVKLDASGVPPVSSLDPFVINN